MVDRLEVPTSLEKDHGQMGKEHPSEEMAARDKDGELRSGKRKEPAVLGSLAGFSPKEGNTSWNRSAQR